MIKGFGCGFGTVSTEIKYPWASPTYWGGEEEAVASAVRSSWISGGPFVEKFQNELASLVGREHAIATSNGTTALHLAYLGLGLEPGDEVVLPGFGFLAAANVALQMKLVPIFCDVDPETWCARPTDIEAVLGPRTRAIVPVHSYGNLCDTEEIARLAGARGIAVVEDVAEALGSRRRDVPAGRLGTVSTFSFHATKTLTTGEGGMVMTDDSRLADRMRLFASHGLRRIRHYWHEVPGHNFRLTNIQAALGCAQFLHWDRIVASRARVARSYVARLNSFPGIQLQHFPPDVEPVVWAIAMKLDPTCYPQGRDRVMQQMMEAGIETRPGFQSPNEMSYFETTHLPVSDLLGRWVISLPGSPNLTEASIDFICETLKSLGKEG